MRGIEGKVAIIPGGATMIGAAIAERLAGLGCACVVADIDVDGGTALAARSGGAIRFLRTDLRRDDDIAALVAATLAEHGQIDFLVNVACTYLDDGADTSRADWLAAFDVNIIGGLMLLQAVRGELARNRGAVVNFGSISANAAQAGRWVYPASKAAILQLTRSQAVDLAADGIRVNAVSPGWTWSNVIAQMSGGDRARADRIAAPFHLPGRVGEPGEVADAVVFLLSDQASFITGAELPVDGGYSAMGPERAGQAIAELQG